jgi:hypothetical protein
MSNPRTPSGLKTAGKRLWRDVHEHLDLDRHESELLLQACRVADHLDDLSAIVGREGVLKDGKPHVALVESRQQQVTFARLIATLRLPEDLEATVRPQRRGAARGVYDKRLRAVGED